MIQLEFKLPQLEGTEKEVAWAEEIRAKWAENYKSLLPSPKEDPTPQKQAKLEVATKILQEATDAGRWIEARNHSGIGNNGGFPWIDIEYLAIATGLCTKTRADRVAANAQAKSNAIKYVLGRGFSFDSKGEDCRFNSPWGLIFFDKSPDEAYRLIKSLE